jgi:transposase
MGKPLSITRTEHSADELRAVASKCRDGAQVRRLLALAFVLDGHTRTDAADQAGMDRQTLRDWVHRYNAEGIAGLKSGHGPGKPPSLNPEQMAELKAMVLSGPDPEKHGVVRWRRVDLRAEVARRYSVEVSKRTVGKWLRKMKLTRLQPRPFHPKKDDAAQAAFKKRARVAGPPVALETGRAILTRRGAAEKFLVDLTP